MRCQVKAVCCIILILSLLFGACTRTVVMSTRQFRANDPEAKNNFRVTTFDDRFYDFSTYSISGDSLIILNPHYQSVHDEKQQKERILLLISDIQSIERISINKGKTWFWLGISAGAFSLIILAGVICCGGVRGPG